MTLVGTQVRDRFIYAYSEGNPDQSRWLEISAHPGSFCVLHLQDLCQPGQVSHLTRVTCPSHFLQTALDGGPLQITAHAGYLLMRRRGDMIHIEFRGIEDGNSTRAILRQADVKASLHELSEELARLQAA